MMYYVFYGKEIIGRFRREEKALKYIRECWSNDKHVRMKPMTKEKYTKYMEQFLWSL